MSSQSLRQRAAGGGQELSPREQRAQEEAEAISSMGALVRQLTPEIQRALPAHLSGERMARIAMTELRKTPRLAQTSRESFLGALLTAAQLGLEFGAAAEAYLVPYGRECQLILGYQGLVKLFYQHPMARHIDAQAVRERDDFDYALGTEPFLRHRPATGDRGDVVAYYAVASLASGASHFVVLSPQEVRQLRGGKTGPSGNIADPQDWMSRKTVLRQLLKTLPKSTTLAQAITQDEGVRTDLRPEGIDATPSYPALGAQEQQGEPQREQGPVERLQAAGRGDGEQAPTGVDPATGEVLPVEEPPGW